MKTAAEMRRQAEAALGTALAQEREKVVAQIEAAANKGLTALTLYEPISREMLEELGNHGYQVHASNSWGRNEDNWTVSIKWEALFPKP